MHKLTQPNITPGLELYGIQGPLSPGKTIARSRKDSMSDVKPWYVKLKGNRNMHSLFTYAMESQHETPI